MADPIVTPCIKVCCVEPQSGLCLGCYRTLPEIAQWSRMAPDQRDQVMADLPQRSGRLDPIYRR